ncbi:Ni/Fe hydrogenase subunit alpha [Rhodobacter capsulatus]|uniref:Ni/Fe hydrogenase subunit alpha n=1 Tax=Rhodobacter capsulatus TaxID=1061 RepID=UPI004025A4F9
MLALETAPALRLPPIPVETVARPACPGPARGETAGQGRVTICLDARGQVRQVQLHLLDLCGVETLLEGRAIAEIPEAVQRLCGLCPVSHHLAAVKAMDRIAGYDRLTPTAEKLRRLMQYGQIVQSHAVQLYHLAEPDLLLGFDSEPARRGLVDVARAFPQLATEGVLMRRFGQEVVRAITGGRLRGAGGRCLGHAAPAAARGPRSAARRCRSGDRLGGGGAAGAGTAARHQPGLYDHPAETGGNLLALVGASGAVDFYDGRLRARDARGATLFDAVPAAAYRGVLAEPSGPGGPHLRALGPETGWYRVGPLARLQVCDLLTSEKAETERQRLLAPGDGKPLQGSVFHHGARLVELLHAAELIRDLLDDPELLGTDLMADRGAPQREAVGVIEAPRGTLLQRYEVDEAGRIRRCTLLLSTRNNSRAMDAALQGVAAQYCDGRRVTEDLLAHIEVAIRAFDPCLSCAAHALGQMPLSVELIDAGGAVVSGLRRGADGGVSCCVRS